MIKNFKSRHKEKLAEIHEAEREGDYILIDQRFDESGRKFMKPIQTTNVQHLTGLIEELKRRRTELLNQANDVGDSITDHETIKAELERLEKAKK